MIPASDSDMMRKRVVNFLRSPAGAGARPSTVIAAISDASPDDVGRTIGDLIEDGEVELGRGAELILTI